MKYFKPEVMLIGSTLVAVQNTTSTKQVATHVDSFDNASNMNTITPPAYEGDE